MKQILVVGNVCNDPETRAAGNSTVTTFRIAENKKVRGEDKTTFFQVNAWHYGENGGRGKLVQDYVHKGDRLTITGEPDVQCWIGKQDNQAHAMITINLSDIVLDRKRESEGQTAKPMQGSTAQWTQVNTDELPF